MRHQVTTTMNSREDPCPGMGAGPENLTSYLWEEALLGRDPGQRAHSSRRLPSPVLPRLWLLPMLWHLSEPLSVWSLLVLAPSSLWNQAQIPGKANRDHSFEEKSESWTRTNLTEHYSSTHSLEKQPNSHSPHIRISCTKLTGTSFPSAHVINCLPQLTRSPVRSWVVPDPTFLFILEI